MTVLFAILKFQHLVERHNPTINQRIEHDALLDASYDMRLPEFTMAFALESVEGNVTRHDPRFIKWFATYD